MATPRTYGRTSLVLWRCSRVLCSLYIICIQQLCAVLTGLVQMESANCNPCLLARTQPSFPYEDFKRRQRIVVSMSEATDRPMNRSWSCLSFESAEAPHTRTCWHVRRSGRTRAQPHVPTATSVLLSDGCPETQTQQAGVSARLLYHHSRRGSHTTSSARYSLNVF
jgi:hypothetical protein